MSHAALAVFSCETSPPVLVVVAVNITVHSALQVRNLSQLSAALSEFREF
jgi:hypothetical protein